MGFVTILKGYFDKFTGGESPSYGLYGLRVRAQDRLGRIAVGSASAGRYVCEWLETGQAVGRR